MQGEIQVHAYTYDVEYTEHVVLSPALFETAFGA